MQEVMMCGELMWSSADHLGVWAAAVAVAARSCF
jgi:hypothetical protein